MMLMMVVMFIFIDVVILVVFDPATCVHQINLGGVEYMTGTNSFLMPLIQHPGGLLDRFKLEFEIVLN